MLPPVKRAVGSQGVAYGEAPFRSVLHHPAEAGPSGRPVAPLQRAERGHRLRPCSHSLRASRACRCLRLASSALEWRVRVDLRDEPDPHPRLRSFVEWATGGPGGRPRNVTRLSLAHQVKTGVRELDSGGRPVLRLPSRSPPGPDGRPMSISCLSAIPTLVALDLAVCHPHSLAGLGELAMLRQLRVVTPVNSFAKSWVVGRTSSHRVASRVLEGSLTPLQGLASLDITGFLNCPFSDPASKPLAWLRHLTQLTHLRVMTRDLRTAVWALPRLEHLHIEDEVYEPALHGIVEKLRLGGDRLSRLTLETCSLEWGEGVLRSSLRALVLLRCRGLRELPSVLPPSSTLAQLRIEAFVFDSELASIELLEFISAFSSVTELHLCGVSSPLFVKVVELPKLRSLTIGIYSVRDLGPGSFQDCFTHLTDLKELVVEVPRKCVGCAQFQQLSRMSPQGCNFSVRGVGFGPCGPYEDDIYGNAPSRLSHLFDSELDEPAEAPESGS